jgi:hypothetical protein
VDDLNFPDANTPDDSDPLVRRWAEGKTFRSGELERITAEICGRARNQAAVSNSRISWRSPSVAIAAISLATAAAVLYFALFRPFIPPKPEPSNTDAELAQLTPLATERMRVLAAETGRLFDQRVAWLAETNEDLLFGLDESPVSGDQSRQQITLRIVVFHRSPGTQGWQPVFATNVVTREEEVIEMQNKTDGPSLRLWTHILPDQSVAVDTDLTMGNSAPHWSTTSVLSAESPAAVVKDSDGPGEYQVWQSAAIMSTGTGNDKGL